MEYRRADTQGGTYFFTVNLAERKKTLLTDNWDLLRGSLMQVKTAYPFKIDAMVILPDHLHVMWTLPPGDADYATRWMLIKSNFSRGIPKDERINASKRKKRERGIWQRRYWEHQIRDQNDYSRHLEYIHYNPVKHGYVMNAEDWYHSTLKHCIRQGLVDSGWASDMPTTTLRFGE